MKEALYLLNTCNVSAKTVSKRLRLSLWKMKELKRVGEKSVDVALTRKQSKKRFGKLHERA